MRITSSAFEDGQSIPSRYTCDGENTHPPLTFHDVPKEAKSLVLLMDDPDVPLSAGVPVWDHWVIFNIPPQTREISEEGMVPGKQGKNTRGKNAYVGPCPPDREHRYFFKLFALDHLLDLTDEATKIDVEQAMQGHVLDHAELIGRYERR